MADGAAVLVFYRRELYLLLTGEEIARSRGVPVDRVRILMAGGLPTSAAMPGEAMIASATTGAKRHDIHAPARNTIAVVATSMAAPTLPTR